tara:strand:- start:27245 stop:28135 length:891 start_codon:yes stop_codon:yes gene_type:complete
LEKNSKVKKSKIVVFSHDAGGAQQLSSYLHYKKIFKVYGICSGPAIKIFKEKKIRVSKKNITELIKLGNIFLTTTSWKSNLEKKAMEKLFQKNKKFVTFIDHWVHFRKRFNKKYLPNEIWSFDKISYLKCKKIFKNVKIKLNKNFFTIYALDRIAKYKKNENYKFNYLYLTEPLSEVNLKFYKKKIKYNELDALNFFLEKCKHKKIKITIRVHPNENERKYKLIKNKYKNLKINFDKNSNVYKSFASNYNIVSYQSSLLYLAHKNRNRVLCSALNNKFKIHYLKNKNHYIYNYDRF